MIVSNDPQKAMILKRNPYFKEWSKAAQPAGYVDEIDYTFGTKPEDEDHGRSRTASRTGCSIPRPADRLPEMSNEIPAPDSHQSAFRDLLRADERQPRAVQQQGRAACGELTPSTVILQLTSMAARVWPCRTARFCRPASQATRLIAPTRKHPGTKWTAPEHGESQVPDGKSSGQAGQKVTVISDDQNTSTPQISTYLVSVLNELGFKATLKVISANIQFTYIQNTKNNVQISLSQWYQDYPAASDFINVLLSCELLPSGFRRLDQHLGLLRQDASTRRSTRT